MRLDAVEGLLHALGTLELERPRDDADGERAERSRDACDHRSAARAGAAALARGDEHHVGALQRLLDVVAGLGRGAEADVRVRAGSETAREVVPDVELDVGVAHLERLGVRVDGDELDAGEPCIDHSVDGVRATATDFTIIGASGNYEESYGGGVSTVATTLYNTTLLGGLDVIERGAHSFYIDRYLAMPQLAESSVRNLIFSGTLERFPKLNFVFAEFGFLFQRYVVLTNAAVEGARVATLPGYSDEDAIARGVAYAPYAATNPLT